MADPLRAASVAVLAIIAPVAAAAQGPTITRGVSRSDTLDRLGLRGRVEAAADRFPHRDALDLPLPDGIYAAFAREAADVHADLFRDHRARYGENVAVKIERALQITDDEAAVARAALERYRERIAELTAGVDLVLTPAVPMVAPPTGVGDLALRERMIELTFPWSAVGAPALALPCGPAEEGLPASVQLAGRPGADALVLGAGRLLERALADGR
jgi:aspartyl-tRNA(Asn)/glutamyl-tRNA(Gln) amidotransferase subunit A